MIEILTKEQQQAAMDLMMSPTMSRLIQLAPAMPLDCRSPDDLKSGFCTATLDLVRALDDGRIHFDNEHDRAMLHGLMMVSMQYVFNGRFGEDVEVMRAN